MVGYFLVASSTAMAISVPELSLVLGLTGRELVQVVEVKWVPFFQRVCF